MSIGKQKKYFLLFLLPLIFFLIPKGEAHAVVPTADVYLSGTPPPFVSTASVAVCPAWFSSKKLIISSAVCSFQATFGALFSWDGIAKLAANLAIQEIGRELIVWANSGFNGSPLFIQDPGQFFQNTGDIAASIFVEELGVAIAGDDNFFCSDFKDFLQIRTTTGRFDFRTRVHCSINQVGANINNLANFYSDFGNGGWPRFLQFMQDNNNPEGVYLMTVQEKQSRAIERISQRILQSSWAQGFLPIEKCDDPDQGPARPCNKLHIQSPGKLVEDRLNSYVGTDFLNLSSIHEIHEVIDTLLVAAVKAAVQKLAE